MNCILSDRHKKDSGKMSLKRKGYEEGGVDPTRGQFVEMEGVMEVINFLNRRCSVITKSVRTSLCMLVCHKVRVILSRDSC